MWRFLVSGLGSGSNLQVKISDLGMSRQTSNNYYTSNETKMPIRWYSPHMISFLQFILKSSWKLNRSAVEILGGKKYTSACDVWSFGVLLWEMQTRGRGTLLFMFQLEKHSQLYWVLMCDQSLLGGCQIAKCGNKFPMGRGSTDLPSAMINFGVSCLSKLLQAHEL